MRQGRGPARLDLKVERPNTTNLFESVMNFNLYPTLLISTWWSYPGGVFCTFCIAPNDR